jgi:hypothetical protein
MMSKIYRGATDVMIWISPLAQDGRAVDECDQACKTGHYGFHPKCQWLQHILSSPYWTRLWIVQEVVLARELHIYVGSSVLHWHDLSDVIQCDGFQTNYADTTPPQLTWVIQEFLRSHKKDISAIEAYKYCCNSECNDPRDKVYGLQAILRRGQRVSIDYSRSAKEVFFSVMSKFSESGKWMEAVIYDMAYLARAMGLEMDKDLARALGFRYTVLPPLDQRRLPHVAGSLRPPLQLISTVDRPDDDDGYTTSKLNYIEDGWEFDRCIEDKWEFDAWIEDEWELSGCIEDSIDGWSLERQEQDELDVLHELEDLEQQEQEDFKLLIRDNEE